MVGLKWIVKICKEPEEPRVKCGKEKEINYDSWKWKGWENKVELWIKLWYLQSRVVKTEYSCQGNMEILKVCVLYKLNSIF